MRLPITCVALKESEVPYGVADVGVVDYYGPEFAEWFFTVRAQVAPGRELQRAYILRICEELPKRTILVGGRVLEAYSWHDKAMLEHGYAGMFRRGELKDINIVFGLLCNGVTSLDLAAGEAEEAALRRASE